MTELTGTLEPGLFVPNHRFVAINNDLLTPFLLET